MKIMVFDVPAESGGALSVLMDFYNLVNIDSRKNIEWIFVISSQILSDSENIKVMRFPWIKKSWLHRLFFDYFIAPKLIRKFSVERILSLQNIIIPNTKVKQILYVHNSLPFVDYKFSITQNPLLWIYQNVIALKIRKSIVNAHSVIAQTKWMRNEFIKKTRVTEGKICVIPPRIDIKVDKVFNPKCMVNNIDFFYPASAVEFKNHKLIIDACKLLSKSTQNYQVLLTVTGDENKNIRKLKYEAIKNNLNIKFIGQIDRDEVFKMYSKTVLLFPSYVESSPLPLTEAAMHNCIVLASNCSFSKEILNGYKNAYFFDPFQPNQLSKIMEDVIAKRVEHICNSVSFNQAIDNSLSIIDHIISV